MHPITIIVSPLPVSGPGNSVRYLASLNGRELCRSRTPFFAAARVLLSEGVFADEILEMKHEGSDTVALRSPVGEAAKLTVSDPDRGSPHIALFREFPTSDGVSRSAVSSPAAIADVTQVSRPKQTFRNTGKPPQVVETHNPRKARAPQLPGTTSLYVAT